MYFGQYENDDRCVLSGTHQAQQVYYLSYPHLSLKNWLVVYKVNREIHTL
jgi:hypothetical protein